MRRGGLLTGTLPPVRIPQLGPACQSGVWNFLSWTPVKTRWIIPNSLDKRLPRGGCAANFYQAFESTTVCFEKAPRTYWHGSGGPSWEQGQVEPQVGCGWDGERQPPQPFHGQMLSIPGCLVLWVPPGLPSSTPTCNGPASPHAPPRP